MFRFFFLCAFLLTQRSYAVPCETLQNQRELSVHQCSGVKVVRLSGKPLERAERMGKLLAEGTLSSEVIHYFSNKIDDEIRKEAGWLGTPLSLLYNQVVRLAHRGAPGFLAEEIDRMALGMGADPIELRSGLNLPDTATYLQGIGSRPFMRFLPTPGCTSVAAKIPGGGFAYGRNLDFASVGIWDKHPMVLFVDPPRGGQELRHLVIGAEGLLFGGVTGVNEEGIALSIHQNFSNDVGLFGTPVVLIGELVLRQARTLEDAEAILQKHRPASLWTFVVTDLNNGETLAVESSQKHFLARRNEGDFFVQTNHAMHLETRATENASQGMRANSIFRMKQAFEMLEKNAPSAANLAQVLSYQEHPEGMLSAFHDVMKAETIQTAIFESGVGKSPMLYLSVDPAPTASGRYVAFPLHAFWNYDPLDAEVVDWLHTSPAKRERQIQQAEAFRLYFDKHHPQRARELLKNHSTVDAALFRSVALYNEERWAEALEEATNALHEPAFLTEPAYIRVSLDWVRLVALLQLNRRHDARTLAQEILSKDKGTVPTRLEEISRDAQQNRNTARWKLNLAFDFFSGDLSGRND